MDQRLGVDHSSRPSLVQDHVLRRDPVQLGPGGKSALGQPGREGIAGDDPGPFGLGLHAIGNVGHHVGERLEDRNGMVGLAVGRSQRMGMAVDEPGQQRLAAGVDHLRARPDQRLDLPIAPHRDDPISPDRHGLGDPVASVEGDHAGVADDLVGDRRLAHRLLGDKGRETAESKDEIQVEPPCALEFGQLVATMANSSTFSPGTSRKSRTLAVRTVAS